MRKPLIVGNWKMNKTCDEATALAGALVKGVTDKEKTEVALCPPFTSLRDVGEVLADSNIKLGAQNVHYEDAGAYTGEVSVPMLKDLDVKFVIIGHSERRQIFGEEDGIINKKVMKVLEAGLVPILCVGETLGEREKNETKAVVRRQVVQGLKGISLRGTDDIVIAYEPIWAIGTGRSATAEDANDVIGYIRDVLCKPVGDERTGRIRILYGGSVKKVNAASLFKKPHIDGALVGGASLKADEFLGIIKHSIGKELD